MANCGQEEVGESAVMSTSASGNMAFQLILTPAKNDIPKSLQSPMQSRPSLGEIEEKLKAAEDRRLSVEADKVEKAKAEERLVEAAQRRKARLEEFRQSTEKDLNQRMECTKENRERIFEGRMEKIKNHEKKVKQIREKRIAEISALEKQFTEELRQKSIEELKQSLKDYDMAIVEIKAEIAKQLNPENAEKIPDLEANLAESQLRRDMILSVIREKQARAGFQYCMSFSNA